jgi:epsilon-lactone hydrolase
MAELNEIALIKQLYALVPSSEDPDIAADRARYSAAADAFSTYIRSSIRTETLGGLTCELHYPAKGSPTGVTALFHGGAYALGSPKSHRHLAAQISQLANCIVVVPDYPLAPEHVFPAALNSAVLVLGAVRDAFPELPLTIMGDSAGGGLSVAAALQTGGDFGGAIRAIVAISPWFDLTCSSPRYAEGVAHDGSLNPRRLKTFARLYRGDAAATDPLVSPIFARLDPLPRMLVQVGRDEILYDDAAAFVRKAEAAGKSISFEAWDSVVHVWHWYWPLLRAGRDALKKVAHFLEAAR